MTKRKYPRPPIPGSFDEFLARPKEKRNYKKRGKDVLTLAKERIAALERINAKLDPSYTPAYPAPVYPKEEVPMAEAKPAISQKEHQETRISTAKVYIYASTPVNYHVGPQGLSEQQKQNGGLTFIPTVLCDTPPEPVPETPLHIFKLPRWFVEKKPLICP